MIVNEYIKSRQFDAAMPNAYFWRDSNRMEVDLLVEDGNSLKAFEIKAGKTMNDKYLVNLKKLKELAGLSDNDIACVYAGDRSLGKYVSYRDFMH